MKRLLFLLLLTTPIMSITPKPVDQISWWARLWGSKKISLLAKDEKSLWDASWQKKAGICTGVGFTAGVICACTFLAKAYLGGQLKR